ncbi:MAG: glutamyl-tRNA reductase [Elusimicrobia bacterium]|nr:glutamyl-tRNA reductase [Elusimicrobiota bacterium]
METANILVVGLNHLTAPVSCREKTAVRIEAAEKVLQDLRREAGLSEIVILSTCSRVEVVAVAPDAARASAVLRGWYRRRAGLCDDQALYFKSGDEAVRHVFRVASGLDSWIIGESEILAQLKRAYQYSLERRHTGCRLNRVFQLALAAGKAVRGETGIADGIRSIGGAAALLARRIFDAPETGQVLVVGAGEAATAVARHLAAKNFSRLLVANRTLEKASAIAEELGGEAVTFQHGLQRLAEVEVAIFSADCPNVLLAAEFLKIRVTGRRKPLFLIDLGVPRNVDPACAKLERVYLYDLDDLKGVVAQSMEAKSAEKEKAEVRAGLYALECVRELEKAEARRADALAEGVAP